MKQEVSERSLEATVVENIRFYLYLRHLNQTDLANALGLTRSGASQKMTGRANWSISDIEKVATLLQVKPEILLSDEVLEKMGLVSGRNPQPTT